QVGQHIHVVASYTDGAGTLEQVSSAPSELVQNINDLPTGHVTLSGTASLGEVLTAGHNLDDVDGLGVITYQWFADGVAIDGATGETLTLTQAQVGARISVAASYTDKLGADEQVLGNTPDDVLNLNDLPVGQVLITGNIVQEQVLTARHTLSDVDGLGALSYQWLADGVAIDGATQARFTLEAEQVGKTISVMLTYTDNFGTREQVSSAETLAILPVGIIPELPTVDVWEELPDIDEDGIPELIESLVPNLDESIKRSGDGNGDGVNDTEQADVASLPFRNTMQVSQNPEADVLFVTLVSGSEEGSVREGSKTAIKSASQLDIPTNLPANLDMPLGMISFTATTETVGGSESFSLFVDDSLAVNGYWKQNAQGAWVNLASVGYGGQVVKLNGKTRLDFVIQDGGEFDEDGVANGVIVDPGAPGLRASSALVLGSVFSESLTGSDTSDVVVSLQNRDTLVGGSGNDVLLGGNPRDVYVWNDALGQGDLAAGSHDLLADRSGVLQFSQATLASLKINGETLYEYQGRPLMVGSQLDANNNIALVNGTLQLDVNGDGAFNAADDARITLHESTGLKFNAKTGLFTLTGNKPQLQTVDLIDINARLGTHTAETLSGDVSNNLLYGLAGRDTLAGGEGDDVLIGGKGRDLYTWAATDLTAGGHDVVLDGRGSLLRFDSLPVTSMQLNGISIDALTHRTQLGSSIDANNGMAWSSNQLRIDVNNDGLFSNAEDFSIQIVGNVTRVMYDAKHDLLVLS
ncbi:MAG: choice-of-anchor U domain-containing protein, partial [Pseudomonas sp.]